MDRHIVLDTETTGFCRDKDRVIEVAAAVFEPTTGVVSDRFHRYINPKRPICEEATKVHGITDEMLAGKPVFKEIAEELETFVAGGTVVIHNSPFDVGFLNSECKRAKRKKFEELPADIVCSRRMARAVRPRKPVNLDALCDAYKIDRTRREQHGALIDCELLAQVYVHLKPLWDQRQALLAQLLPFAMGSQLPKDRDVLGRASVAIGVLLYDLKKEQDRIEEELDLLIDKKDYECEDFEVKHGQQVRTAWDRVIADHLEGVDLTPYQKPSPTLRVIGR